MASDPQWAVRWAKRAAKAIAAICLLLVLLAVGWLLLPEAPAEAELRINTKSPASLNGRELGTGEILLDDTTLRAGGVTVPVGTELKEIAAQLFPGEEFRGPFFLDTESMASETEGYECYLHSSGTWRIARVWIFVIEDEQWLAVPIEFRDERGRVHTKCPDSGGAFGWAVTRSLAKRCTHEVSVTILPTDGTFPGEGEIRVGPMMVR